MWATHMCLYGSGSQCFLSSCLLGWRRRGASCFHLLTLKSCKDAWLELACSILMPALLRIDQCRTWVSARQPAQAHNEGSTGDKFGKTPCRGVAPAQPKTIRGAHQKKAPCSKLPLQLQRHPPTPACDGQPRTLPLRPVPCFLPVGTKANLRSLALYNEKPPTQMKNARAGGGWLVPADSFS